MASAPSSLKLGGAADRPRLRAGAVAAAIGEACRARGPELLDYVQTDAPARARGMRESGGALVREPLSHRMTSRGSPGTRRREIPRRHRGSEFPRSATGDFLAAPRGGCGDAQPARAGGSPSAPDAPLCSLSRGRFRPRGGLSRCPRRGTELLGGHPLTYPSRIQPAVQPFALLASLSPSLAFVTSLLPVTRRPCLGVDLDWDLVRDSRSSGMNAARAPPPSSPGPGRRDGSAVLTRRACADRYKLVHRIATLTYALAAPARRGCDGIPKPLMRRSRPYANSAG